MTADTYPHWVFDGSPLPDPHGQGEAMVRFLRALRHPATGRPFQLDHWQERVVRRIYGDTLPNGERRIRNVVMMVPRGARKTSLGAGLGLAHTVCSTFRVPGGQVILAAYNQIQARIAFDETLGLVMSKRAVESVTRVRDQRSEIVHRKSRATMKAVSADAAAQNGKTPRFVLFDEVHAWRSRKLYDVLRTGLSKTDNTLSLVISQAGRGTEGLAHEIFDYARKVARDPALDPGTLPILFETPADADWRDEATWHRANPGLALGYPNLAGLRQFAREAENRPAMLAQFKNDHLCVWLESNDNPWLDLALYDRADELLELEARSGETCWIGVDLGRTDDLTAVVACFRDADGGFSIYPWVFAPEETIQARTARGDAPYGAWKDAGHLIASPGATTDYRQVKELIVELCDRFDVAEIAADPWNADWLLTELTEEGLPAVKHRQGYQSINEPMRALEEAVIAGRLRHGGHPVLRWCVGNTIASMDPAGNVKPNKAKSKDKIDAAVAAIMAVGRAHFNQTNNHIACDEEKRPHGLLVLEDY